MRLLHKKRLVAIWATVLQTADCYKMQCVIGTESSTKQLNAPNKQISKCCKIDENKHMQRTKETNKHSQCNLGNSNRVYGTIYLSGLL